MLSRNSITFLAMAALFFYSQTWLAQDLADGGITKRAEDFYTTVPFLILSLFAMLELEALAVAQSVAYRHLAGLEPRA